MTITITATVTLDTAADKVRAAAGRRRECASIVSVKTRGITACALALVAVIADDWTCDGDTAATLATRVNDYVWGADNRVQDAYRWAMSAEAALASDRPEQAALFADKATEKAGAAEDFARAAADVFRALAEAAVRRVS